MSERPPRAANEGVILGIALTFVLHIVGFVLAFAAAAVFDDEYILLVLIAAFAIGIAQLAYMLPAILIAYLRGRGSIAKGFIIGAAVTAMLNTACWGLVTASSLIRF